MLMYFTNAEITKKMQLKMKIQIKGTLRKLTNDTPPPPPPR